MANNRLYVVNTDTKEYCCIAKGWGADWQFGNADILDELLYYSRGESEKFIFVKEHGDDKLYDQYITNGKNINESSKWDYFKQSKK